MTFRLRLLEGELLFQTGKVKKAAVMLEKRDTAKKCKNGEKPLSAGLHYSCILL